MSEKKLTSSQKMEIMKGKELGVRRYRINLNKYENQIEELKKTKRSKALKETKEDCNNPLKSELVRKGCNEFIKQKETLHKKMKS